MKEAINEFSFPTHIVQGYGAIKKLPDFLKKQKVLLVADKSVSQLPFFNEIINILESSSNSVVIFNEFEGNPLLSQVNNGHQIYEKEKCSCLLGLGGGAALDICKAIAILVNHEGSLLEYEDAPGKKSIDKEIPLMVAIPTTSGTGSEVGRSSVVANDEDHIKKIFFAASLMPAHVILDPNLTITLPAKVTAYTGIDALTHLLEAYCATGYHPLCDSIALEGLALIKNSLPTAYESAKGGSQNLSEDQINTFKQSRADMQLAAMMGGVAFQKGLGAIHSCAHALSAIADLHHGLANAIMLPYVLKFNQPEITDRLEVIEQRLDLNVNGGTSLISYITQLLSRLDISIKLKDHAVDETMLDDLVDVAFNDVCHQWNPREINKNQFINFFKEALND